MGVAGGGGWGCSDIQGGIELTTFSTGGRKPAWHSTVEYS